jgi:hypothetical protein
MAKKKRQRPGGEWTTGDRTETGSESRAAAILRVQLALGYLMVGVAVAAGFAMNLQPRWFGMTEGHPAVAFGLAALAVFRLVALRRELRRQANEVPAARGELR